MDPLTLGALLAVVTVLVLFSGVSAVRTIMRSRRAEDET